MKIAINIEGIDNGNNIQENHAKFLQRLKLKMKPADFDYVDLAYDMAKYAHRNQKRISGERYFEHLRAVALIFLDELDIYDSDIIIAGLLHDTIEDTFLLNFKRIRMIFNLRIAKIVEAVTKDQSPNPKDKSKLLNEYYQRISSGKYDLILIKLVDNLHNLRTLGSRSLKDQKRKLAETKEHYLPLIDKLAEEHPEQAQKLKLLFTKAIKELEEGWGKKPFQRFKKRISK